MMLSTKRIAKLLLQVSACALLGLSAAHGEETPNRGGGMVVALGSNPAQLNIGLTTSVIDALPSTSVIEGLIRLNSDLEPVGVLASSWTVSEDGRTFVFKLRQNVLWHDGTPFTAKDVLYSLSHIAPLHGRAAPIVKNIESMTASDDHTVNITLKEPFGPFLDFLTSDNVAILPAHIYENTDPLSNPFNMKPIGTGPFKFESWVPGQNVTLVRNEHYWDSELPYLDRLVFSILPDANSRMLALEAGDVDLVTNFMISASDISRLKSTPGIIVNQGGGFPRPLLLILNNNHPVLKNASVRKALFRGIDRQMIVDGAFSGEAEPGQSSIPPAIAWAHNPNIDYMKMYAFDPAQAEAELDAAGYPRDSNGRRFALRVTFDAAQSGFPEIGEILRANWGKLGVDLKIESRERNVMIDSVFQKKDFDVFFSFYSAGMDPAVGIDRAYRCDDIRPAAFTNASQYCNPELDRLLNEARIKVDRSIRADLYKKAQEIIANDLPTAVLVESPHAQAISDQFGNIDKLFEVSNDLQLQFNQVYRIK